MTQGRLVPHNNGQKFCGKCEVFLNFDKFSKNKTRWDGLSSWCRVCSAANSRRWYRDDPSKMRRYNLRKKYGLTVEEADALLATNCALCGAEATSIDHCHRTGKARSGLCHNCNTALGKFYDDPDRLRRAAQYVEGWQIVHAEMSHTEFESEVALFTTVQED